MIEMIKEILYLKDHNHNIMGYPDSNNNKKIIAITTTTNQEPVKHHL